MLYSPVYKQFTLRSLSLLFSTSIGQEMNIVIIKFQIGNYGQEELKCPATGSSSMFFLHPPLSY